MMRRVALSFGIAWLLGATAVAAAEARWLKVPAPDFTVVTSLPEKDAVAWAGEFAQFVNAMRGAIAADMKQLPRLTIVVFGREQDFAARRPLGPDGRPQDVGGFFSRRDSWAVAALPGRGVGEDTRRTIFHEGTHWFLSAFPLPNPIWLEEGLAEVFSTFQIEKGNMLWGRPIEGHVQVLNLIPPMPTERLLTLVRGDLFTGGEEGAIRTGIAYAQSWAFVHYLVFGQREVPLSALQDYVRTLHTAAHPTEAFRAAFRSTYAEMDEKMAKYLRGGRYFVGRKPLAEFPPLHAEPAAEAEVTEALARLALVARRFPEALALTEKLVAARPEDPRAFELLGQVQEESGNEAQAQEAYARAIEKGSTDFRPHFEVARARHAAATSSTGGLTLTAEGARDIANRYERAINLNPRYQPAYRGLAGVVELVPAGNDQDARFLELGAKLFPDDGIITIGRAVVAKKAGDDAAAEELLGQVLAAPDAHPTRTIAYARRLEDKWQAGGVKEQVDALAKEKKYDEALALVAKEIEVSTNAAIRRRWEETRRALRVAQQTEAIRTAFNARRWSEARQLINEFLESDAPPTAKIPLRRHLEDMDRRGLGLPKEAPAPVATP